ncbi:MAG: hypothetical protein HFH25_06800 [Lachnospiraceae bacterium]|nr:hypothetical protein [Lachnospiraceae bacterium]
MNHKLIDLPLLARFKDKFERKLEDLNTEVDEKFEEVNANLEQVFRSGSNAKQMIVDACVAAGLNITTEDSWNIIATTIEEDLLYIPPSGIATLAGASSTNIYSATVPYPIPGIKFTSNTPVITQSGNGVRFNKDTTFELTIRSHISANTGASVKCIIRLYKNGAFYKILYSNGNVTKGTQGGQSMSVTITDTAKVNDVFSMTAEAGPFGGDSGSCSFNGPKATFTTLK